MRDLSSEKSSADPKQKDLFQLKGYATPLINLHFTVRELPGDSKTWESPKEADIG